MNFHVWCEVVCASCNTPLYGQFTLSKVPFKDLRDMALERGWQLIGRDWFCKNCQKETMTKKETKAAYDKERRSILRDVIREKKRAAYAIYGPLNRDKEREIRKARMPKHVEYCRQPQYRVKKHRYDIGRRDAEYAEFSGCKALLMELLHEIKRQEPNRWERYRQSGRGPWSLLAYEKRRINRDKESERKQGRSYTSNSVDSPKPQTATMEYIERSARQKSIAR